MMDAMKEREAELANIITADGDLRDYAAGMNRGRLLEVLRISGQSTTQPQRAGLRELLDASDEAAKKLHQAMIDAFPVGSEVKMVRNGHISPGICKAVKPRSLVVQFEPNGAGCEVDLRWFLESVK